MTTLLVPSRLTNPVVWIDAGLVKAGTAATQEPWMIYIQASAPVMDHEGEVVIPEALRDAADYMLRNGKVTYEHVTKDTRTDPTILIGEPTSVHITPDGRTLVTARLYEHQPKAQAVWNILQSGGRLKASIGGTVLARDPNNDAHITKVFWNHLALTSWPVNEATGVSLTPYAEFVKSLCTAKALGATTGTSAQPLVMEDLEGARLALTPDFAVKWEALTEVIARTYKVSQAIAKQLALETLAARGETRQAYRSNPVAMDQAPSAEGASHAYRF